MSFLAELKKCPLIASAQASPGSALESPEILEKVAQASLDQGVKVLRLQGIETIRTIRRWFSGPIVGLVKKSYPGSEVYITPTLSEVEALLAEGCQVIALDATDRPRPGGVSLQSLVQAIHAAGALAWADCDSVESLNHAKSSGCDVFSTTLAGYTGERSATVGPDMALLAEFLKDNPGPVFAEGRFSQPWQMAAALRLGAAGVVVGGSLNDPVKQTQWFIKGLPQTDLAGAVDLGGTWLRFALAGPDLKLNEIRRTPQPRTRQERLDWIAAQIADTGVTRLGVSAGGTIDPVTGEVWEAKDFIPEYLGTTFAFPEVDVRALNDGLAAAWGHFCRPETYSGRVASLALGTGVGAGYVIEGQILMGHRGSYPRWNDLPLPSGRTVEDVLGGLSLTRDPSEDQKDEAEKAARLVIVSMDKIWMPEKIVITGGVGLSPWLRERLTENPAEIMAEIVFGPEEAGLEGAAALAIHPQRS